MDRKARMGEDMSAFKILAGKPTGKRLFGRPILEEDNIRMDLKEIGISARNWADSTEDWDYWRAVRECGIEPPGSISHGFRADTDHSLRNAAPGIARVDGGNIS